MNFVKSRLFEIVLFSFIFIITLSQFLSVRLIFVLLLLSFFIKFSRVSLFHVFNRSWDIFLYLLVMIIGLTYSSDLFQGFKVVETSFSLLAIPIIFYGVTIDVNRFRWALMSFISGLFVACIICLSYSGFKFIQTGDSSVFYFEKLTSIINTQPTYMAYYLCFALTVGLYFLYLENIKISISLVVWSLVLFFIVLMLTGGRTAYVSMVFVFSFFILKFLFDEVRLNHKRIAFALAVIFMVSMLVINQYNFNSSNGEFYGDYWERITLWNSAINASKDYIFGVGTGDYKYVLNEYYKAQGLNEYAQGNLNSHNQFIQSFFSNGIFGLMALTIIIARPLYLSFKIQNSLGILIIFPFIMYGVTEVFLGRYQGVVFFALCHQIVVFQYYLIKQDFSLKNT